MNTYRTLSKLKSIVNLRRTDKVVLVTSAPIKKQLGWAVDCLNIPGMKVVIIPDGEKAKEWDVAGKLLAKFTEFGLTKKSLVVAMGGGSVSDLVGFTCSIYKRGAVAYVNVPTTLLAQVDASIGGKTAINFCGHKNLVGSFHDPITILVVPLFLRSLGRAQFVDGMAEIVKAGFIRDPEILKIIQSCEVDELREKPDLLMELIRRAATVKERFVGIDRKDKGPRQLLNLGHTVCHALELKYRLSHGTAVLWGMLIEFHVAEHLGMDTVLVRACLKRIFKRLGIDPASRRFTVSQRSLLQDKKISGRKISFPVVETCGKAMLIEVELIRLMAAIKKCNQKQL